MNGLLLDLLRKRRSIRKFTSQPVEADKRDALIEAALRTPTSRARSPWEFIMVTDRQLLNSLGSAKLHGSAFLAAAPLAIVIAADPDKSDVWTEDCAIAAMVVQLAAEDLGLGSCWAQIRLRPHDSSVSAADFVKSLLGLPAAYEVACIIGIGYPDERLPGHAREDLLFGKIHQDRYGR